MKTASTPTESSLKRALRQNPVIISSRALNIFPAAASEYRTPILVGTICRNLLFYELQLLSACYGTDRISDISAAFRIYTTEFADFLLDAEVLPLLICRKKQLRDVEEVRKIRTILQDLPKAPSDAPADILLIQKMLTDLRPLLTKPPENVMRELYLSSVRWMNCLATLPMQVTPAEPSLDLALFQMRRNLSRHQSGRERRKQWGKEVHSYYLSYLSHGYCDQTAKRLSREDFVKSHPFPTKAEDQMSLPAQPGLHRNSIRFYLKTYLESENSPAEKSRKHKTEEAP